MWFGLAGAGGQTVDRLRLEAVYEHGTLKLTHELPLPEGQRVMIMIPSHQRRRATNRDAAVEG
jgi:hypothetical protein